MIPWRPSKYCRIIPVTNQRNFSTVFTEYEVQNTAAILKSSILAIITSRKAIMVRCDAILDQSECMHLYKNCSNYTKTFSPAASSLFSDFVCLGKNICIVITDTSDNIEAKKAVVLSPNFSVTKPPMSGPAMIPREKARPSLPKAAALPAKSKFSVSF